MFTVGFEADPAINISMVNLVVPTSWTVIIFLKPSTNAIHMESMSTFYSTIIFALWADWALYWCIYFWWWFKIFVIYLKFLEITDTIGIGLPAIVLVLLFAGKNGWCNYGIYSYSQQPYIHENKLSLYRVFQQKLQTRPQRKVNYWIQLPTLKI